MRNANHSLFHVFASLSEATNVIFGSDCGNHDFVWMTLMYVPRATNSFFFARRRVEQMKSNLSSLFVSRIVWHDDLAIPDPAEIKWINQNPKIGVPLSFRMDI